MVNLVVSDRVSQHLVRVFGSLSFAGLAAATGVCAHFVFNVGGFVTLALCLVFTVWLAVERKKERTARRLALLGAVAFFLGCVTGPLLRLAVEVDPAVVPVAVLATTCIFLALTGTALVVRNRVFLALGPVLGLALSGLLAVSFVGVFFPGSEAVFSVQLWGGLAVFCGYVLFDTQLAVERASRDGKDADYIDDAVNLFLDFFNIFVRIVSLVMDHRITAKKERVKRRSS